MDTAHFRTRWVSLAIPGHLICVALLIRAWPLLILLRPVDRTAPLALGLLTVVALSAAPAALSRSVREGLVLRLSAAVSWAALLWGALWLLCSAVSAPVGCRWVRHSAALAVLVAVALSPVEGGVVRHQRGVIERGSTAILWWTLILAALGTFTVVASATRRASAPFAPIASAASEPKLAQPDIVLIVLDEWSALRSSLPGLGYGRVTTPAIGKLAVRGRVYARVITNAVNTHSSLKAVFTGLSFSRSGSRFPHALPESLAATSLFSHAEAAG